MADLARAAGLADAGAPVAAAAAALTAAIEQHLEQTGFAPRLADLGVAPGDIPRLVGAVEGTLANDPGPVGIRGPPRALQQYVTERGARRT